MNHVTLATPTPVHGTIVHLLYRSQDGELSERLVRLTRANATHWEGVDLLKNEYRRFCRAGLFWAKTLTDSDEQRDVLYRLLVHQLFGQS